MANWSITITATDGTTYTPALYAPRGENYPQEIPTANGVPKLKIGVTDDVLGAGESWFDAKFENCDIDVSKDGTTLPYSTVRSAQETSTTGLTVLTADGGPELQKRVDESFGVIETHNAAEQVVTNNTSYGVDIPTPTTTTSIEAVRARGTGLSSADLSPQKDTSPAHVNSNGELTLHQTLHFHEPTTTLADINDTIEFDFTTGYSIPAGEVGVAIVDDADVLTVEVEASVDDTVIGEFGPLDIFTVPGSTDPTFGFQFADNVRIPEGDHTARFEVVGTEQDGQQLNSLDPDGVVVYDTRFSYTFDPQLVDGPELYPRDVEGTRVSLPPAITTQAVTGIDFSGDYQDGEPVEVTIGTAGNDITGFGDQSADFQTRGASVNVEIGFRAYGSDSTRTPQSGFKCTTLQSYNLTADLETMPMTVNERYQGTVAEVLSELGDTLRGDFVWTYDTDSSGNPIVRFVRAGTRTSADDNVETYNITKNVGETLQEVKVIGGPVEVTGEQIRVQHGLAVNLQENNLVEGSESVEFDGDVKTRGREYTINYDSGTITAVANPPRTEPIPDDALVTVNYAYQPSAVVTASGVSDPERTTVVDELPLRSEAACSLAAEQILDAAQSPRFTASAQLRGAAPFSAVAELDSARLPGPTYEVVDISATVAGTQIRLEAQQPPGEVINDVETTIRNVARHVR